MQKQPSGIKAGRRLAVFVSLGIGPVLLSLAHGQSVEHINHCAELLKRSGEAEQNEYVIDEMEGYKKGTVTLSDDYKNQLVRDFEALQNAESSHDTDVLRERQRQNILRYERQVLTECSDVESTGNQAMTLFGIGRVLIEENQPEDAIPILRRCTAMNPDNGGCWEKLGEANIALGKIPEARDSFRKAIDVGGFDEMNAAAVKMAKFQLKQLEERLGARPVQLLLARKAPSLAIVSARDFSSTRRAIFSRTIT